MRCFRLVGGLRRSERGQHNGLVETGNSSPLNNENFWKIIDFYLFNCPVKTKSEKNFKKFLNEPKRLKIKSGLAVN